MNIKTVNDYTKLQAYEYAEDNQDIDILFNIKLINNPELLMYLDTAMVAELFSPLLQYERLVITVHNLEFEKIKGSIVICYYTILSNTFVIGIPKYLELKYHIQLYNWPALIYSLTDRTYSNDKIIYSEIRNVSLSDVKTLKVYSDCNILGFYASVNSRIFPDVHFGQVLKAPKICTDCIYFSKHPDLPCAVNPIQFKLLTLNDKDCKDYQSIYKS